MNFKDVWNHLLMKSPDQQNPIKNSNLPAPKNVYSNNITNKELFQRFNLIHYIFKYKILIPGLWITKFVLRKIMVKEVDDEPYNRNLKIFQESFDKALMDWTLLYRRLGTKPIKSPSEMIKRVKENKLIEIRGLNMLKELTLTLVKYDTAYKEFFNMLMHEITKQMMTEYTNGRYPNKTVGHLLYSSANAYDVRYMYLFEKYETNVSLALGDAIKLYDNDMVIEKRLEDEKHKKLQDEVK